MPSLQNEGAHLLLKKAGSDKVQFLARAFKSAQQLLMHPLGVLVEYKIGQQIRGKLSICF